jgi:hypothetical protein
MENMEKMENIMQLRNSQAISAPMPIPVASISSVGSLERKYKVLENMEKVRFTPEKLPRYISMLQAIPEVNEEE